MERRQKVFEGRSDDNCENDDDDEELGGGVVLFGDRPAEIGAEIVEVTWRARPTCSHFSVAAAAATPSDNSKRLLHKINGQMAVAVERRRNYEEEP